MMNPLHQESALVTICDYWRETTGWISKFNRVLPERLVVNLKCGLVAIDCHGIGIAIDRDGDLLAGVTSVSEGNLRLQFVAAGTMLAAHLKGKQIFTWNARSHRAALVQHRAVVT